MKNIQVIDSAENCAYDIYAASEEDFAAIVPEPGQDIEFIGDVFERLGKAEAAALLQRLWPHPVEKPKARGIHGTLFYELDEKKEFYPTKRERDLDGWARAWRHDED